MPRIREVTARTLCNQQKQVIAGKHTFIVDEAEEDGGDGLGPSPISLLLAALGT